MRVSEACPQEPCGTKGHEQSRVTWHLCVPYTYTARTAIDSFHAVLGRGSAGRKVEPVGLHWSRYCSQHSPALASRLVHTATQTCFQTSRRAPVSDLARQGAGSHGSGVDGLLSAPWIRRCGAKLFRHSSLQPACRRVWAPVKSAGHGASALLVLVHHWLRANSAHALPRVAVLLQLNMCRGVSSVQGAEHAAVARAHPTAAHKQG
jgi:hypothetical protein